METWRSMESLGNIPYNSKTNMQKKINSKLGIAENF